MGEKSGPLYITGWSVHAEGVLDLEDHHFVTTVGKDWLMQDTKYAKFRG